MNDAQTHQATPGLDGIVRIIKSPAVMTNSAVELIIIIA